MSPKAGSTPCPCRIPYSFVPSLLLTPRQAHKRASSATTREVQGAKHSPQEEAGLVMATKEGAQKSLKQLPSLLNSLPHLVPQTQSSTQPPELAKTLLRQGQVAVPILPGTISVSATSILHPETHAASGCSPHFLHDTDAGRPVYILAHTR